MIKASWYHNLASKNRLGCIGEDPVVFSDSDKERNRRRKNMTPLSRLNMLSEQQLRAKRLLLQEVNTAKGDLQTGEFQSALQQLLNLYDPTHFDPRKRCDDSGVASYAGNTLEGVGISAGKPTFPGCIGHTTNGDPMYKLGTMSFGRFSSVALAKLSFFFFFDFLLSHIIISISLLYQTCFARRNSS